jgi:hypothetical protein
MRKINCFSFVCILCTLNEINEPYIFQQFVALFALVAVANAGVLAPAYSYAAAPAISYAAPIARLAVPALAKTVVDADYDANPQYNYAYSVADALTGDNKHQEETRNGDTVQGSYSLVEADGTTRTVTYTADSINGFNAVVSKSGTPVVAAPAIRYAAPVIAKVAAPVARLAYAAPALSYAAPIAHVAHPAVAYAAAPAVVKTSYASPYASYVH